MKIFLGIYCNLPKWYYLYDIKRTTKTKAMKKHTKKQQVKILGQLVTVGSKEWERLSYQVKLFNQVPSNEQ